MNTENMNQNADPASVQGTGERTFTQDDVNRIVVVVKHFCNACG